MTENITSIVIKLDTILTKTTRVLENENLNNDLQSIVKNISYSTEELAKIISNNNKNIDSAVKNLTQISSDLKIILKENKPQIDVIIKNLETAAIEINKIIPQIDTTINKTNKLLFDADGIVNEIKSNNGGTISKIIYDKEFAKQIDTLVQSLDGLVKQIKEHGINANIRLGGRP
ncbi:hypothetical protein SDC9_118516 [bioreactor metagenome]|uniref:Uncharacterized protein n=1 Tax=bioreactor metagenome TaxID=1076179 RepID=A0A645C1N8_9ZZZZ